MVTAPCVAQRVWAIPREMKMNSFFERPLLSFSPFLFHGPWKIDVPREKLPLLSHNLGIPVS